MVVKTFGRKSLKVGVLRVKSGPRNGTSGLANQFREMIEYGYDSRGRYAPGSEQAGQSSIATCADFVVEWAGVPKNQRGNRADRAARRLRRTANIGPSYDLSSGHIPTQR
jgi:hypothetical protein